jgi:hypothetical protein
MTGFNPAYFFPISEEEVSISDINDLETDVDAHLSEVGNIT